MLAIAGAQDIPTPPEGLAQIASGVRDGRLIVLDGVGHLAPAEAPDRVADLIAGQLARNQSDHLYEAGMAVRREVLGDAHVDRAVAATNDVHRRLPGTDHPVRMGHRSGPGPDWTGAAGH